MSRASLTARAVVLAALLASGVSACSSAPVAEKPSSTTTSTTPANVYDQQRTEGVDALLGKLAKALQSGDRATLDDLIDPLSDKDFRTGLYAAQTDLSDKSESADESDTPTASAPAESTSPSSAGPSSPTARKASRGGNLTLRTLSYRVEDDGAAEQLVGGALSVKLNEAGSSDSWITPVVIDYALGGQSNPGVDEPLVSLKQTMAFSRYGDDWKLLGDHSVLGGGSLNPDKPQNPIETAPWSYPGLRALDVKTVGGPSAILSYPDTDRTVGYVREQLAPAVKTVTDFWGKDWPRKAVVVVTGDTEEFAGLTRTEEGATSGAAAATVYANLNRGTKTVSGQRVVLSPAAGNLTETGIAVILRHELFHVATRLITDDKAPLWLTEGVAEYVGRLGTSPEFTDVAPDLATSVSGGEMPAKLPSDADFAIDDEQARVAYQSAWSFAAFIADEHGEDTLKAMYRDAAPTSEAGKTKAAVSKAVGTDYDSLITDWQSWLQQQVR